MAPRAYWKGFLRLSLVSCPIQLFPATSEREKVSLNQINAETGNRIRYRKVDEHSGEEVEQQNIVKAYQVEKGQYIEISDEELEAVALKALQEAHPERVLATNVEYYSAIVLDVAEIPPPLAPAMFACSRVAGWSAHILEQKRLNRLVRPSARYVGPAARSFSAV